MEQQKINDSTMKELFIQFDKEVGFENFKFSTTYKNMELGKKSLSIKSLYNHSAPEQQKEMREFWDCFPDDFWLNNKKVTIDAVYEIKANKIVKDFLDINNIDFISLASKLENIGIQETNTNLSNKINRGKFSLSFLLQVLDSTEKYLVLDFTKQEKVSLSKEVFIKHFLELNTLYRETDLDEIYKKLDKTKEILLKKAGFTDDVVEYIDDTFIHLEDNLTDERMNEFYNEIFELNEISKKANNIHSKILSL